MPEPASSALRTLLRAIVTFELDPSAVDVQAQPIARPAARPSAASPLPSATPLQRVERIHRQIHAKATEEPQTAKGLARRAGYLANSYSRTAITALCRAGHLTRTPDGIVRGPVPFPE
jgi:hypothetical protein